MKKVFLMFAIFGITSNSFAKIIIRQVCCNTECSDKCWEIKICGKKNPCGETPKLSFEFTTAQVKGNKFLLTFNVSDIKKQELEKLLKNGVFFQNNQEITSSEIEENAILGTKKAFIISESKGSMAVNKKVSRNGPVVTLTISVTIKWGK